eukprot:7351364-Prymnesium_polylepis.1
MNGAGHSTGANAIINSHHSLYPKTTRLFSGSHFDNYKGCLETSYMLNGAGYRGTDPQMLAADDKALLEYLYDRPEEAATI